MTRLIIFAKAPVAGAAKTRLIPSLGAAGAANFHAAMVEHTVAIALAAGVGPVELNCTPDATHPVFESIARLYNVVLTVQGPGNLGERMSRALERVVQEGEAGIIVGTDCAALDLCYLQAARSALDGGAEIVIGPAEDGGYVLIGARLVCPELFMGNMWGTDTVLQATRQVLRTRGIAWQELTTLWDVDRPQDLDRLRIEHPGLAAQAATARSAEKIPRP